MMLYTNLENVYVEGNLYKSFPVLRLTSEKIAGEISSNSAEEECENFFRINNFNKRQTDLMKNLVAEAKVNSFIVSLGKI